MKSNAALLLLAVLVGALLAVQTDRPTAGSVPSDQQSPLVVFVVRHAEKLADQDDPGLAPAGEVRAQLLASMLKDAGIGFVHSSDFRRTRETAMATAESLGLEVQLYDPADQQQLVQQMTGEGGRHLVVGHSNTVGELVTLLGGDSHSAIDEATEYDRLYIVHVDAQGTGHSVLLRYGASPDG